MKKKTKQFLSSLKDDQLSEACLTSFRKIKKFQKMNIKLDSSFKVRKFKILIIQIIKKYCLLIHV